MENFLEKILAEKQIEVAEMVMERPGKVREVKGFI